MSNKPTIIPGMSCAARVEYRACQQDVEAMLAKGYSIRMVYEHLKEEGRVSCSYSAFCDYVRGGGKRKHSRSVKKPKQTAQVPPRQTSESTHSTPRTDTLFVWPSNIDPKTLI